MNVKKWSPWTPLYKSLHSSGTITQISNFAISTRSTASHDVRKAGFDANAWIDSNRKIKDVCQRRTQRGEFTNCIAWDFLTILNTFMLIFCCKHTSVQIICCWHEEAGLLVGLPSVDRMLHVVSFCKHLEVWKLLSFCFHSAGSAWFFFWKIETLVACLRLSSFFENVINWIFSEKWRYDSKESSKHTCATSWSKSSIILFHQKLWLRAAITSSRSIFSLPTINWQAPRIATILFWLCSKTAFILKFYNMLLKRLSRISCYNINWLSYYLKTKLFSITKYT